MMVVYTHCGLHIFQVLVDNAWINWSVEAEEAGQQALAILVGAFNYLAN